MAPSLVSPVLVGRRAELQSLTGALERVLAGEQVTVLVGGEAGVGKSRLVHELMDRARGAGARVLVGGCVELGGGGIPFAPLVDMLRALAVELPGEQLEGVLGPARAEIGRLVPELQDGLPGPAVPERDPSTLLELMVGMIARLAGDTPLMASAPGTEPPGVFVGTLLLLRAELHLLSGRRSEAGGRPAGGAAASAPLLVRPVRAAAGGRGGRVRSLGGRSRPRAGCCRTRAGSG